MSSGPPPWLGIEIKILQGHYKGYSGAVVIDYEHVREPQHYRTLIEIAPLKQSQIFYQLRPDYTPHVYNKRYTPQPQVAQIAASATPPPSPTENQAGMELWWEAVMDDSEPATDIQPTHWILHPAFNNVDLNVSIAGCEGSQWIHISNNTVAIRKQGGHLEYLDVEMVLKPIIPPRANTGHALLAVVEGIHTGQFVQRVGSTWICGEEKIVVVYLENAGTVNEKIGNETHTVGRSEVVLVREQKGMGGFGSRLASQFGKQLKYLIP
ncbi:hypothetical protein BDP27DRAFT_1369841 [Rhodocollybia butyracea]|uniref:Uncharacterized protein n=1 Tax=Rhodocollybia butyracea TaxID=206335 RepID=A0A9P5PFP3_9AGAR|nr:hypothetical protein BDP27DRAFT_1369841 [Rhodocollybia butyracea]